MKQNQSILEEAVQGECLLVGHIRMIIYIMLNKIAWDSSKLASADAPSRAHPPEHEGQTDDDQRPDHGHLRFLFKRQVMRLQAA